MFDLFRGFRAVFFKETLHVRRDPSTLFFSLVIPLLQMVVTPVRPLGLRTVW